MNVNVNLNFKMTLGKTAHIENGYKLQAIYMNLTCYLHKHNQHIFKHLIKNKFMPHSQIYLCLHFQSFQISQI